MGATIIRKKNYPTDLRPRLRAELATIGENIAETAKQFVPVETGTLQVSIVPEIEDMTLRVGTNVEYAPFVELGTKKMQPQPFLKPAFDLHRNFIVQRIQRAIREASE